MAHKEQLKQLKIKHRTWSALAAVMGVTPQTLGNWRRSDVIPNRAVSQINAMCALDHDKYRENGKDMVAHG